MLSSELLVVLDELRVVACGADGVVACFLELAVLGAIFAAALFFFFATGDRLLALGSPALGDSLLRFRLGLCRLLALCCWLPWLGGRLASCCRCLFGGLLALFASAASCSLGGDCVERSYIEEIFGTEFLWLDF